MDRPTKLLIVRLGALGDLVHALPSLAALRAAWPDARIDWLVDARYAALMPFVRGVDRVIVLARGTVRPPGSLSPWEVIRDLRRQQYDIAIDLQGLIKSAVLARVSGARRVLGFSADHLREPAGRVCYSERVTPEPGAHVVHKNLAVVRALGVDATLRTSPLDAPLRPEIAAALPSPDPAGRRGFAIVNPGAGWPNKRWPVERFGAVAAHLRSAHGLPTLVTWGPGEQVRAEDVVRASGGAAALAPATQLGDLIALLKAAVLFVGGDTGPLQLAAAVGTPTVSIFGPTNPARNGSWMPGDLSVSRFDACECHHKRQCRRATPCIDDISTVEVQTMVDARLAGLER